MAGNEGLTPKFTVLTLFPDMIAQGLSHSVIGRAVREGIINLEAVDIRDYTGNKHRQADDYPYGGGCGMVMKPEPVYAAYTHVLETLNAAGYNPPRVLLMTPRGKGFDQNMARELSRERAVVILCGHYEGIDERVMELIKPECVSIGDYVLSGGEIPAMAVIDAAARLIPGVLKNEGSALDESFSNGLLEYPQYTRPAEYMGLKVPEVLLSGDHGKIDEWRRLKSLEITRESRPDMLENKNNKSTKTDTLETERLVLRPVGTEDFEAVHSWCGNPVNTRYMCWGPNSEEQTRDFLTSAQAGRDFAVVLKETGRVIGTCGIYPDDDNDTGELGWILHLDYWQRGYGTELGAELIRYGFEDLGLRRVSAPCAAVNYGSCRVMERNGMRREALHVKGHWARVDKEWIDGAVYALLADEYFKRNNG